jgi:hypothetical protein
MYVKVILSASSMVAYHHIPDLHHNCVPVPTNCQNAAGTSFNTSVTQYFGLSGSLVSGQSTETSAQVTVNTAFQFSQLTFVWLMTMIKSILCVVVKYGRKMVQRATSQIKKWVLELGGSDPIYLRYRTQHIKGGT